MKHSITLIIIFPLLLTSPLFRQFMITTNSSQVDNPPSKIPYSCKIHLKPDIWELNGNVSYKPSNKV